MSYNTPDGGNLVFGQIYPGTQWQSNIFVLYCTDIFYFSTIGLVGFFHLLRVHNYSFRFIKGGNNNCRAHCMCESLMSF